MKGISYQEFGGPEVLQYGELPDPIVGADQALVRMVAVGVNPMDTAMRAGYIAPYFNTFMPMIPGVDLAGEIVGLGPTFEGDFKVGDRVHGFILKDYFQHGTYAELVAVPERLLVKVPDGIPLEQAAALPCSGLAALQSLRQLGVGPGGKVLVNAAGGGVGHLAVQIARELGAEIVIGGASETNQDFVRELGAEPVVHGEGVVERVAEIVGGDGKVDAVVDLVGDETLDTSLGVVDDPSAVICLQPSGILERGGRMWTGRPDAEALASLDRMVAAGAVRVTVGSTFPVEGAADAHRLIEGRGNRGKIVLTA